VKARVQQFGPGVERRLKPDFLRAGVPYPPAFVTLIALKNEKVLEVYAAGSDHQFHPIRTYRIQRASGKLGPKLKEGDCQVPEGIYGVESLNPNSSFHLALRVNYPNKFDQDKALQDRRSELGGDIMIHGGSCSIGCIAMGDEAAEDLFVLSALTGLDNIKLIFSPVDFRITDPHESHGSAPIWTAELYKSIKFALQGYPKDAHSPK
jgi:murein L,D-transpeptidase YafK